MKKLAVTAALLVVSLVFVVISPSVSADVNDFRISDYRIDYFLGKDSEGRSTLRTTETITAEFPATDQNHGLERAIPKDFDGHSTSLAVTAVTDDTGNPYTYTTYQSAGHEVLRIGDASSYVHGSTKYVISYTQRDVSRYFADTKRDEWYWDTNGTQWRVPIDRLQVQLHLEDDIRGQLTGDQACYEGRQDSNQSCTLQTTDTGFAVSANSLAPGENVTLAVGFQPETFSDYTIPLYVRLVDYWIRAQMLVAALSVAVVAGLIGMYYRWSNRRQERTSVTPEYVPPKGVSVTAAAQMYPRARNVFTAQIIDLAVRHYLKIYQTKEKSWLRPAKYELEIVKDIQDLLAEEKELLTDIFPSTAIGSRLALDSLKNNHLVGIKLQNNPTLLRDSIRGTYGLRAKAPDKSRTFRRIALVFGVMSLLTFSVGFFVVALAALVLSFILYPLTDSGLALYRYMEGLKLYIKTAETDRLRMLQSPDGALKVAGVADVQDPRQLVKLYEQVLPYAILFGLEKDWNKQIGAVYESIGSSPDWYNGLGTFRAASFATGMSNFASAASYTPAGSSSSGGSSGGGSSGGGGGGGGGGGW